MTTATETPLQAWLERVQALAPLIEQQREAGEQQRRLPRPLAEAMREAGLFSLWMPRNLGGAEVDVGTSVRVVEELSRLDGAVGWNVMIAGNTATLWANVEPAEALAMTGGDPRTVIAGTVTSGAGTAIPVDGGYRVSGRWPFASGCHQADWLVCVAQIVEDSQPRRGPDGNPQTFTFVLPAQACEILDTWHTLGMRATGSHDFQVADLFVPEARHFPSRGGRIYQSGPLYNTSLYHVWAPNIAAVALGIARAALDAFASLAAGKRSVRSPVLLAERETTQQQFGRAETLLRAGRAFLYQTIRETWPLAVSGREVAEEQTAVNRLAASGAVEYAVAAVDLVFQLAGTSGIYQGSPLERCFRDIHVVQQHAVVSANGITQAGRALLGLGLPVR